MKKALCLILLAIILCPFKNIAQISCVNGDNTFNFGEIQKGDSAMHKFEFRNTGSEDLTISSVTSNNKHLKFRWPHKTIKVGKKDVISVSYISASGDGIGSFQSDILVAFSSMPNPYPLFNVKGVIVPVRAAPIPKSFDTSTSIKIPLSRRDRSKPGKD